jgi:alanyl-tRNA synthetase
MASNSSDWTAPRVRETFLDYFKKNGHTFGELRLSLSFFETPPKISPAMKLTLVFT